MQKDSDITNEQQLSIAEEKLIEKEMKLELISKHFVTLRHAAITCILGIPIIMWSLYGRTSFELLIYWAIAMAAVHSINLIMSYSYHLSKPTPTTLKNYWLYLLRTGIFISAFTWGSMGFLLVNNTYDNQAVILFYLILVASALTLGTTTDFISALIGISCMILPFIIWNIVQAITSSQQIHLQYSAGISVYMVFLIVASLTSNRLLVTSTKLGFVNKSLSGKLAVANSTLVKTNEVLEHRVSERTRDLRKANTALEYQATHDELTGLINTDEILTHEIDSLIILAKASNLKFAVIYLSLNNLSEITNNYGVKHDNEVVKDISTRLQTQLSDKFRLFLNRRDTFVILLYETTEEAVSEDIAFIKYVVEKPFAVRYNNKTETIPLKASIGIALYPEHGEDAETLKMNADLTMSYAKQLAPEQTHHAICSKDTSERLRTESKLKQDFLKAIKRNEFFLEYQPVVDLHTGKICSAEVLVRWQHPHYGLIPPLNFIELAERNGEIVFLGEWILNQTCRQIKKLHQHGFKDFILAANLSARQIESGTLVDDIKFILQDHHIDPKCIELEMTETAKFSNGHIDHLRSIDALGINLALDDFGQGQSGLNMLKEFDFINKIKIDRAFIKDLPHDERSKGIVINSVNLARSLSNGQRSIKVVVEGVDKAEQLPFLQEHGVDLIQGYYFSKPLPEAAFIQFLLDHPKFDLN